MPRVPKGSFGGRSRRSRSGRAIKYRNRYVRRNWKNYIRTYGKFKLRQALDCSASDAGEIHYTWTLTGLSATLVAINGAAPANSVEEIGTVGGLYDQYRVTGFKIKYIPQLPNDTSTVTGFFPLYSVIDRDTPNTSPPVTTIAGAVQYDNLRVYNMYRPWSRYVRVPRYVSTGTPMGWLDLANISNYGCAEFYGTGFDISQKYGKFIVTYYVTCRNRR